MVIHNIDRNSTCVEPIKDITEGEMLLGRTKTLELMKLCGIIPKHQVSDNRESKAYMDAMRESGIIHQLVPPDDHL